MRTPDQSAECARRRGSSRKFQRFVIAVQECSAPQEWRGSGPIVYHQMARIQQQGVHDNHANWPHRYQRPASPHRGSNR
eukprot:1304026-Prymnesium_polylepis.1